MLHNVYTNIAGYAKNTISWDWLVEKVLAALNNEVKECWLLNFKVLWTKDSTVDYLVYTDIAGFTMMMTSATFSVHYNIQKICLHK